MDGLYPDITRGMNIVLTIIVAIIAVCFLVAMWDRSSGRARADRFSMGVRLPYGSDQTRVSVARALRARAIAGAWAIVAGAAMAALLLLTPLATSAFFIFYTLLTGVVVGNVIGTTIVAVHERLFHPAPDAPRVARARVMTAADYLGPARLRIPWVIAGAAAVAAVAVGVVAIAAPTRVQASAAIAAAVFGVVAAGVFIALPRLERLVLDQPQPASHSLELAWDDALRAATIMSLRLSCAIAGWLVLSFAIISLTTPLDTLWSSWATQIPTWGIIALSFIYPASTGRPLPAALYPDWLRHPVPAGSTS
ncbi:hypothetical protein GCM10009775_25920 [Microbacterium aoyamense]|uniref:SdpI/YhfL protein family protein n=1 Tax=Microbacterium aoyamense TaxID=344166 RepID=A0ABP5B5U2_9MICO|nr:hypothetical protein [Microbacterium aoyamense]